MNSYKKYSFLYSVDKSYFTVQFIPHRYLSSFPLCLNGNPNPIKMPEVTIFFKVIFVITNFEKFNFGTFYIHVNLKYLILLNKFKSLSTLTDALTDK